jgi:hypothetical protein
MGDVGLLARSLGRELQNPWVGENRKSFSVKSLRALVSAFKETGRFLLQNQ